ncbi:hypothetical protein HYC85_008501 [Camellia sinensis]|uniref:J domain-containing protein n=1 Tax=Camellia sinensis TaxID=4442 RepID=A0A7J7HSZ2_CAMSI|nr:hypothetical protein HYC85_008501 [Camellia sinensis]
MDLKRDLKRKRDKVGVREDANYEEIRTSYRSAILDSHPDKLQKTSETSFPNHESGNRFLEVQRAWEILSNSKSRVAYDSELQASWHDFVAAEDVGLEDLTVENTGEFLELFYQCRCGDYFSIDSSELEEMGLGLPLFHKVRPTHLRLGVVDPSKLWIRNNCLHLDRLREHQKTIKI